VRGIAESCVDEIVRGLRTAPGSGGRGEVARDDNATELIEAPESPEEFDAYCRDRGWSDGLPLIVPTRERVARLLAAHAFEPGHVVAHVAPAFGAATAERLAVNAVMAGLNPAAFPVLVAAVEALGDPAFNLQGIQTTTNPATPWIIVNGPIAASIGMNAGVNCLGPGNWSNASIGRAVRLALQNIGGGTPGEMDRASQGQPGKYAFCCAENETASPWDPLHVERGYNPEQSTVTVVATAGTLNLNSHTHDARDLLKVLADTIANPMSNDYWYGGEPWIIVAPEHAHILHRAGFTKPDVKHALWESSKLRAGRLTKKDLERPRFSRAAELGAITEDTLLPIATEPGLIGLVVAGGPGTHSVYVPGFGNARSVTRAVVTASS